MKIWKYFTVAVIAGTLYYILKSIFKKDNKLLDYLDKLTIKSLEKADKLKKEAKVIKKEIKKSKKKRRNIRDKFSKIVSIILIFVFCSWLQAKYLVYDYEDNVWRDYGNITNYCKSLELEKEEFLKNEKRYEILVSKYSNAMVCYSNAYHYKVIENKSLKKSWIEKLWEQIDAPVAILFTAVIFYLLRK